MAAAWIVAGEPAGASAATYAVDVCSRTGPGADISVSEDQGNAGFVNVKTCAQPSAEATAGMQQRPNSSTVSGGVSWTLAAPEGTLIHSLSFFRSGVVTWDPGVVWDLRSDGTVLESISSGGTVSEKKTFIVDASSIVSHMFCTNNPCPHQSQAFTRLTEIVAVMEDNIAPTVSLDPSLGTAPVRGTIQIPYSAKDKGSGITGADLFVDGAFQSFVPDSNGGKCALPFKFLVPCKLNFDSSFSLDTTQFPVDGVHTVEVLVGDAPGLSAKSSAVSITVHNAPTNTERPLLKGSARIGTALTATSGKWEGAPSLAFQWLRCPASVKPGEETGCSPITGATEARYVPVASDLGNRITVKVAASNSFGSATAGSNPSAVITDTPPQTRLGKHPRRKTASRRAVFTFTANPADSSIQCKLDRRTFKGCHSPFKMRLRPGRHVFKVRAVTAAGTVDPTPAMFRWRVR
jgi:hypothetical protein